MHIKTGASSIRHNAGYGIRRNSSIFSSLLKTWRERFTDTRIAHDVFSLLEKMDRCCAECGNNARFLWVDSRGLTGENFGESLDKGLSKTILPHNPPPVSLCSRCCVKRIETELEAKRLHYLEVSAPKGSEDGFVMPMGY